MLIVYRPTWVALLTFVYSRAETVLSDAIDPIGEEAPHTAPRILPRDFGRTSDICRVSAES